LRTGVATHFRQSETASPRKADSATTAPCGLSVLQEFGLGFAVTLRLFVEPSGSCGLALQHVGLPLGIVLQGNLPTAMTDVWLPRGCMGAARIMGISLMCGAFLSIMICGLFAKASHLPSDTNETAGRSRRQWPPALTLPIITTGLFLLGMGSALVGNLIHLYRASRFCRNFWILVRPTDEILFTAVLAFPVVVIVGSYWFVRSGRKGDFVTLFVGMLYAAASVYASVSGIVHDPLCVPGASELPLFVGVLGMFALPLWVLLYSIATTIDMWSVKD